MRASPRPLAALAIAGAALWLGLGMHRGLLLSSDIKSKCWPWAPSYPSGTAITAPALSDPVWQFVPWVELARRELRAGRLPLWNPHQDGGVPLLGNAQSALGSPLLWPALALGAAHGWNLSLLARALVALAGAWLWLRDRGRSPVAAALGALAFALSGPFVAWLEHPQTLTAAPIPLLLLSAGRLAERPTRAAFLGTVLATYLVLSGGHPETALMAAILAANVALARAPRLAAALRPAGAALLGAALAAPLLLPFLEYYSLSAARLGADRQPFTLPLAALVRFVSPREAGSHPIEGAATISLAALLLVPFGLARLKRDGEARLFAAVAAVCLLAAYDNPLARFLSRATPVYWSRALLVLPLALGWLAAAGLDGLRDRARAAGRHAAASGLAAALVLAAGVELLLAARGVHGVTPREELDRSTPLLARLAADPDVFRVLPLHTFLPPNTASTYGLDDVRGYDALSPRGWRERRRELGRFRRVPTQLDVVEPWDVTRGGLALDSWNVKYLLLHPQFRFGAETLDERLDLDLEQVYSGADGRILLNRRVLPRARWSPAGSSARVTIREREPMRWVFDVDAPGAGSLEVANPFFPGWEALVDERPIALAPPPGDPVRIAVPAGPHRVTLRYRPVSFRIGLVLAALALLASAVTAAALGRRHAGHAA